MAEDGRYWIDYLGLAPHPEGGHYRVTYTADLTIATRQGHRSASTAIYFLLREREFSAFHRIASDEVWHFYAGGALVVSVIEPNGQYSELHLGRDVNAGEVFQGVVKAGCWFGARLKDGVSFALVGCTVAPGFDFADFELATRSELVGTYPQHRDVIEALTRH